MSVNQDVPFPSDVCLFCNKQRKKRKGKEELLTKCVTYTANDQIKESAIMQNDYDMLAKVNDVNLIAKQAHYHRSCYKIYTHSEGRNMTQARSDENAKQNQNAHAAAFEYICETINESIIKNSKVERIGMLKEKYMLFMQQHYPEHYNGNYKTDKLKDKIKGKFGNDVQFWQLNHHTELVFSSAMHQGQSIETAFDAAASENRRLEEAAMLLRRVILAAQRGAPEMPWPPPPGIQLKEWDFPPAQVSNFLSLLISGKEMDKLSADSNRKVISIGRDIVYAVTKGRWMTPKHILLGMSIWHLTGRADIVKLLNRFGHCISYSRLLEILTAIHMSIKDHDSLIPPGIRAQGNEFIHFCWDNFDLTEETSSGAGTTHSTHGLVIQETNIDQSLDESDTNPSMARTKMRSVTKDIRVMEPCFVKQHVEPILPAITNEQQTLDCTLDVKMSDIIWILCRVLSKTSKQIVPGWGGWVSLTEGNRQEKETSIEYMPPINAPITENMTVMHVLKISQDISASVGQPYTFVTFDLAAAKKAYAILWTYPERFHNVIIRLGAFHMACAYISALGKYVKGSGYEEVVVESAICASGSIESVLNGKHYNRARYVYRTSLEALERLLWSSFQDEEDVVISQEEINLMITLAKNPNSENLSAVKQNIIWKECLQKYDLFKAKVRSGEKGKTAQFWISFMDKVYLLMRFLRATKVNDVPLHMKCLQEMCPLFFSQDKPNYARYTALYLHTLLNLQQTHPGAMELLHKHGISVNRSEVSNSRNAVDITIEQTYNRHASGHGPGIIGFSRNFAAYHRWSSTRHARAGYLQATLLSAGIIDDEANGHKDITSSEITKGEYAVLNVVKAFQNFINPFCIPDTDKLYCISSGRPATDEVASDVLTTDDKGKHAYNMFAIERLVEKRVKFTDFIKKMKLKTFRSMAVVKSVSGSAKKAKELVAERNIFGQLFLLAIKHDLCMEKVMAFPLGPIPWSLATADGTPSRTDKSKLLHSLEEGHTITTRPATAVYVIDGNAVFQSFTQIPQTFRELAHDIFMRLPNAIRVDFVTDTYHEQSIKNIERERRGTSQEFLIQGPLTKVPRDFKNFLANSANKKQLVHLLLKEWKDDTYAPKLKGRQVLIVCEEDSWCLSSDDGCKTKIVEVPDLKSTQEEADSRIILHCCHIATHCTNDTGAIIVRSPDTDVFLLLLTFSQVIRIPLIMDTGFANKRRLISINSVVQSIGNNLCSALLSLHAFTGCDSTSAFVRKGKLKPLRLLQKNPQYISVFQDFGKQPSVTSEQFSDLEAFTCLLYGAKAGVNDINKVRHSIFLTRYTSRDALLSNDSGIDLSLIPPCRASLRMHILRANYQSLLWKHADVANPNLPKPHQGHGWILEEDRLEYQWIEGEMLPVELIDLLLDSGDDQVDDDVYTLDDVIDEDDVDANEDIDEDIDFHHELLN